MAVLARGNDSVHALQQALGGTPPRAGVDRSKALIRRYVQQRSVERRTALRQAAAVTRPLQEKILASAGRVDAKQQVLKEKRFLEQKLRRKISAPKRMKLEPRMISGSSFWFKTPPYDAAFNQGNFSAADATGGDYQLGIGSIGNGTNDASAGVAVWFLATNDDPQQRFSALLQYSDDWWDVAMGYVAHNDLRTRLWVWGPTEQQWLVQAEVNPSWSDGASWFDHHGNDPQGDAGTISVETTFPATAGNFYLGWIWSEANVYADGGFFGVAGSSLQLSVTAPLVVFGSLF